MPILGSGSVSDSALMRHVNEFRFAAHSPETSGKHQWSPNFPTGF